MPIKKELKAKYKVEQKWISMGCPIQLEGLYPDTSINTNYRNSLRSQKRLNTIY